MFDDLVCTLRNEVVDFLIEGECSQSLLVVIRRAFESMARGLGVAERSPWGDSRGSPARDAKGPEVNRVDMGI